MTTVKKRISNYAPYTAIHNWSEGRYRKVLIIGKSPDKQDHSVIYCENTGMITVPNDKLNGIK